jgi:hypothetical protein
MKCWAHLPKLNITPYIINQYKLINQVNSAIINFVNKIGTTESDSEESILQKNFMIHLGSAMSVGGIV